MQVEDGVGLQRPQPRREAEEALARLQLEDGVEVRIVPDERTEPRLIA